MSEDSYDYIQIGEYGPPWTSMSKESMAKVMNAVLRTEAAILSTYVMQIQYAPRTTVLYSIKIKTERVADFVKLSGYKINRPIDIQLGMETHKSVKRVVYDVDEDQE